MDRKVNRNVARSINPDHVTLFEAIQEMELQSSQKTFILDRLDEGKIMAVCNKKLVNGKNCDYSFSHSGSCGLTGKTRIVSVADLKDNIANAILNGEISSSTREDLQRALQSLKLDAYLNA